MAQKTFNLKFVIGKPNKNKEAVIYLRYYAGGERILIPSQFRIPIECFDKTKELKAPVFKHPNASALNTALNNFRVATEYKISKATTAITLDYLQGSEGSSDLVVDYVTRLRRLLDGKLKEGTLRHYVVIQNKISEFDPKVTFNKISIDWLQRFEKHIRKDVDTNTINANMKKIVAILSYAADDKLLDREQFRGYKMPAYVQNIPTYLTETEIEAFKKVTLSMGNETLQRTGYYFLLSCYTGYRISDLKAFNYDKNVSDGIVILRAKKNGNIVSIPAYSALFDVLEYCKVNLLLDAEPYFRKNLKTVASAAGIKKDIKPHSGRHTFAMLMISKGLSIDQVAELLGDSKDVARIYARLNNKDLHDKIRDVMK